jgi:REP element-mobilizing transposase RayT
MARPWRIEFEGALYHILSRGNEQQDIFRDNEDRASFMKGMREMSERFDIDIFAYVLMNNHYHVLLRTSHANLSRAMQWLGATYTRRFNNRHLRSGHLFQGRFKNIIVQNDAYLMQLSCYIHRNPIRAGIVKRLADYEWSSYPAYAYGKTRPDWLNLDLILSQFGSKDRHGLYRNKVQRYAKEEKRLWEDFRHGLYLGSREFVDTLKSTFLRDDAHAEIPQQAKLLRESDPQRLLEKAARILDCNVTGFRQSLRIPEQNRDKRDLLIYVLWETGMYKNQEIGDFLGLTYSSVSRRATIAKARISGDSEFRKKFKRLKSQIKI